MFTMKGQKYKPIELKCSSVICYKHYALLIGNIALQYNQRQRSLKAYFTPWLYADDFW